MTTTANDILDLYWDGYLPIKPVDIAKQMGVNLISNSELEYSGHFRFTKDGTPTIEYNNAETEKRQRFTNNAPSRNYQKFDYYH